MTMLYEHTQHKPTKKLNRSPLGKGATWVIQVLGVRSYGGGLV